MYSQIELNLLSINFSATVIIKVREYLTHLNTCLSKSSNCVLITFYRGEQLTDLELLSTFYFYLHVCLQDVIKLFIATPHLPMKYGESWTLQLSRLVFRGVVSLATLTWLDWGCGSIELNPLPNHLSSDGDNQQQYRSHVEPLCSNAANNNT